MAKKVLITGGGGSIGVHLVADFLENTDWAVVVLDSFHHKGYRDRLNFLRHEHPEWSPRITEYQHDLVCPISPEMSAKIGPVDYIFHLAALSDVFFSIENPVYVAKNNVDSTLTMLEYARQIKPEQFIYFSTDEAYGPVPKGGAHKEWSAHRPSNIYAASKAACEDFCYAYWRSYGVPVIITNTMNNLGFMQSASKFPVIIQKKVEAGEVVTIHGNKEEIGTRFYIDSRITAEALRFIVARGAHNHLTGEIDDPLRYHIVGDRAYSNLELAELIAKLMGKDLKYELVDFHKENPAHDIHYGLEDNNLRPNGWKPSKEFEQTLSEVIDWQTKNLEWIK